jgi:hypothetical protein
VCLSRSDEEIDFGSKSTVPALALSFSVNPDTKTVDLVAMRKQQLEMQIQRDEFCARRFERLDKKNVFFNSSIQICTSFKNDNQVDNADPVNCLTLLICSLNKIYKVVIII